MGILATFVIGIITCILTFFNICQQSKQSTKNRRKSIIEKEVIELNDLCQDISKLSSTIVALKDLTAHTTLDTISKTDIILLEKDIFKYLHLISLKINDEYKSGEVFICYVESLIETYENYFLSLKYRKFKKNEIEFNNLKDMKKELHLLKEYYKTYKKELNSKFYNII
ncbi:hypothetical protein HZY83_00870 [Gemella sp. GH3]|uniref:hypothetical protein n=1 Tax=unclassified Gemella TaxID=2624949 RepID=UPI0015D080B9|nr:MULTISPECIES: hypothetical protein [unclassified Gemella]MBF0713261.1 hypothetical protein [Gemella sp. GH3.1]NYS50213.1 hypothetical protein [Gemella sp. GH3]